eukprot:1159584-Pelagomonas_calceolata.AAC.9
MSSTTIAKAPRHTCTTCFIATLPCPSFAGVRLIFSQLQTSSFASAPRKALGNPDTCHLTYLATTSLLSVCLIPGAHLDLVHLYSLLFYAFPMIQMYHHHPAMQLTLNASLSNIYHTQHCRCFPPAPHLIWNSSCCPTYNERKIQEPVSILQLCRILSFSTQSVSLSSTNGDPTSCTLLAPALWTISAPHSLSLNGSNFHLTCPDPDPFPLGIP